MKPETFLLRRIRRWLYLFIVRLVLGGVTAFPCRRDIRRLARLLECEDGKLYAASGYG